jgi:putative membrane protein
MTRKHAAAFVATAALSLLPAMSIAQTLPPSTSPPSSSPPATPTPQPRVGGSSQPPAPNQPVRDAPIGFGGGDRGGQKSDKDDKTDKADKEKGDKLGSADQAFAMAAAGGGLAEVELGKLAIERAANADVKTFGQRMVDDHGRANDELSAILREKGITSPTELKGKEKATYDRLAKLTGAAFDKAYIDDMVKDHEKDVKEFERASTSSKDTNLKAFATKTLPTLQDHLKMARDAHAKVSGGTN